MKCVFFSFCYEFTTRYIKPLYLRLFYTDRRTEMVELRSRMFANYCGRASRVDSKILQPSSPIFECEIIICASLESGVTFHAT